MSIASLVTRGFSNGSFTGSIPEIVTRGFTIGEDLGIWTDKPKVTTTYTIKLPSGEVVIIGELFTTLELYNNIELTSAVGGPTWSSQTPAVSIWTDK